MRNIKQAGILVTLLIIPALVFLGLKLFGENRYSLELINPSEELQIYDPKVVNCDVAEEGEVHKVPSFNFTNQDGKTVTNSDLDGKIYIADFFFTRCTNICLTMASELLRVQDKFKGNPHINILSHSVDPEHDQPEMLKEYAQQYNADPSFWQFVTGDKDEIYEMARCGYFIVAKPNESLPNDFIHSDKLVLIDREKRIRGYYSGTDREEVDRLIMEIQVLLHEYEAN